MTQQRAGGMHSSLERRDQRAIQDLARNRELVRARLQQIAALPANSGLPEVVEFLNALKRALESER